MKGDVARSLEVMAHKKGMESQRLTAKNRRRLLLGLFMEWIGQG